MFAKAAALSAFFGGIIGFVLGSAATLVFEYTASVEIINFFEP